MGIRVRPWFAPAWPGTGTVPGVPQTIDAGRKATSHQFGFDPDSAFPGGGGSGFNGGGPGVPLGSAGTPRLHQGQGTIAIADESSSGEFFPESRIRKQWDGKNVGQPYLKERPRIWEGD